MALRARNASRPRPNAASALRSRKAAKKIKVIVGPVRKSNPPKRKRRPARKSSVALHSVVALAPKRKRRSSKKGLRKRRHNPATALALAPTKSAGVKRSLTRLAPASKGGGYKLLAKRKNNPPKRKRRALSKRRRNPAFDVKSILMKGGILIAGAFVANYITPKIEGLLVGLFAGDLPAAGTDATAYKKSIQENLSMLGYVELLGAVGTIALGEYLQQKFGSAEVDLKPATYAIATHMALRGISNAFPTGDTEAAVSANVDARVAELAAAQGLKGRYGGQHGRHSGLSGTLNGVMGGTMGYGPGPSLSALRPGAMIVDNQHGLPSYGGGRNAAMLGSHPMHGSIMTDAEIGPAVVPHNPMAGLL